MKRQSGFTLLEVLIVMTIATGLVMLGLTLFRTVGIASKSASTAERDWVTELFLRQQMAEADPVLGKKFALVRTEDQSFTFVTRRTALHGELGPPALVRWWYDAATHGLRYREIMLPPWWTNDAERTVTYEDLTNASDLETWETTIFSDVSALRFHYWDESTKAWDRDFADHTLTPPTLRLELTRLTGPVELAFQTRKASSSSSSSGSSSAAP